MAAAIAHRGPDDEGFFEEEGIGLAHRRLAIIDLAGGRQPLYNEDRSAVVVFNGEIYNHAELRARLKTRGHRFASQSDTEAIIHAWEERGDDCVLDLRGMFAFAVWDRRRRRLLLARDRLGIKPLYYYAGPRFLAFASEIKALLALPEVPREVDPEALELYLALRYVPAPRTFFRGIRVLEPGHVLSCEPDGQLRVRRYWDLPAAPPEPVDRRVARERLASALEESVELHRMSDVPLGVFLSGGLDSTAVLALLSRLTRKEPLRSYTVGYDLASDEAQAANEFAYARLAAESFGADHRELGLGDADFQEALPTLAWHLDQPLADPACVPLYFVSRLARREITVVLSGEGADEILGGYGIYRRMLRFERLYSGLGGLGRLAAGAGRAALSWLPSERARQAAHLALQPLASRYRGVSRAFLPETRWRLLGRNGHGPGPNDLLDAVFEPHFQAAAGSAPLEQMLYVDLKTWLADDLLAKADKMTMANSQELRVPFLDHRVVELAASLPSYLKVAGSTGKVLLREAMAGIVPRAIITRPKKGFPVPTAHLLRRLGGWSRELLTSADSACRSHFDMAVVERLLTEHDAGARRDQEIWSLLMFELWHGVFIDRRFEPAPSQRQTAVAGRHMEGRDAEPTGHRLLRQRLG